MRKMFPPIGFYAELWRSAEEDPPRTSSRVPSRAKNVSLLPAEKQVVPGTRAATATAREVFE